MIKIAVTGGIGSGKSTVAQRFGELGAVVIDADALAREVVEPGTDGLRRVVERFGRQVLNSDGSLNRAALARIVFNDPVALDDLNALTHPLIGALAAERISQAPVDSVVVYDVALLTENRLLEDYDAVVVVEAPLEDRVARLVARGLTESDARARIAVQATDEQRRALATVVLDNSGSAAQLRDRVEETYRKLTSPGLESPEPIG